MMSDRKKHYWNQYVDEWNADETELDFEDWLIAQLDEAITDSDTAQKQLDRIARICVGDE